MEKAAPTAAAPSTTPRSPYEGSERTPRINHPVPDAQELPVEPTPFAPWDDASPVVTAGSAGHRCKNRNCPDSAPLVIRTTRSSTLGERRCESVNPRRRRTPTLWLHNASPLKFLCSALCYGYRSTRPFQGDLCKGADQAGRIRLIQTAQEFPWTPIRCRNSVRRAWTWQ